MTDEIQASGTLPIEYKDECGRFMPGVLQPGAGRPKGRLNKFTNLKNAFIEVFEDLQETEEANLTSFATRNPKDFYKIISKLFPTTVEVSGPDGAPVSIDMRKLLKDKIKHAQPVEPDIKPIEAAPK